MKSRWYFAPCFFYIALTSSSASGVHWKKEIYNREKMGLWEFFLHILRIFCAFAAHDSLTGRILNYSSPLSSFRSRYFSAAFSFYVVHCPACHAACIKIWMRLLRHFCLICSFSDKTLLSKCLNCLMLFFCISLADNSLVILVYS